MRIVIDDSIPYADAAFGELGELVRVPGRDISRDHLTDAEALIVRTVTTVDEALLAGTGVRFVGSCTIGIDHLDTGWLDATGIHWCHAPGCNANAVAEYVLAGIAAIDGLLPQLLTAEGRVGLVGFGNVGRRVYERCAALGIACIAYDPLLPRGVCPVPAALDEVLRCEVVTLHVPLTTTGSHATRHMFDAAQLDHLPAGGLLINTSRGGVLANGELQRLLQRRADLRLILDVWEYEPEIDTSLAEAVTIGTPHIAGYSREGKLAGTVAVMRELAGFIGVSPAPLAPDARGGPQRQLVGPQPIEAPLVLQNLIRLLYDIRGDHALFRQQLGTAQAGWFEALRRGYRPRHEWAAIEVTAENPQVHRMIESLFGAVTGIACL